MSETPVKTFAKKAETDAISWVAITCEGVCWLLKPRNGGDIQAKTNGVQKIWNSSEAFASQYYITTGKW